MNDESARDPLEIDAVSERQRKRGNYLFYGSMCLVAIILLAGLQNLTTGFKEDSTPLPTSSPSRNPSGGQVLTGSESTSWIPNGYSVWQEDGNVAWRWLKASEFDCSYGDGCWGIMIIPRMGCPNGLYAELSLLDADGTQVGFTNDSLSSSLPREKSKMIFETFDEEAQTGRLSRVSCY